MNINEVSRDLLYKTYYKKVEIFNINYYANKIFIP